MKAAIRKRFTYANIVMTIALIFAMAGGAFAASHAAQTKHKKHSSQVVITSLKQISPAVLKALKGNAGPAGERGSQGPVGEKGALGAPGEKGTNGASVTSATANASECKTGGTTFTSASGTSHVCNGEIGEPGEPGQPGISVTNTPLSKGDHNCEEGGAEFKVGSDAPTYACNGSPWTVDGTLPPGKSETGVWSVSGSTVKVEESRQIPLSFPVALAAVVKAVNGKSPVYIIDENGTPPAGSCRGNAEKPEAEPGNLCVFVGTKFEMETTNFDSIFDAVTKTGTIGKTGDILSVETKTKVAGGSFYMSGTWAVTACTASANCT